MTTNVHFVRAKLNYDRLFPGRVYHSAGRIVTAAYVYNDADRCIEVAFAECTNRDRFTKSIGRDVAVGRFDKGETIKISFDDMGGSRYGQIAAYINKNIDLLVSQGKASEKAEYGLIALD